MDWSEKKWTDWGFLKYIYTFLSSHLFSALRLKSINCQYFWGRTPSMRQTFRESKSSVSKLFIHEHFDNTDGNFNNDIGNTDWLNQTHSFTLTRTFCSVSKRKHISEHQPSEKTSLCSSRLVLWPVKLADL